MGIFEQMCMSQNGRQGSPQEDRVPPELYDEGSEVTSPARPGGQLSPHRDRSMQILLILPWGQGQYRGVKIDRRENSVTALPLTN